MKVWNVIVVHDVYAIAETPESARAAIIAAIASGEIELTEQNAIPVNAERGLRESWREQKPFVGDDVSDADFETLKGKTTLEIFKMINEKLPADPTAKTPKSAKK